MTKIGMQFTRPRRLLTVALVIWAMAAASGRPGLAQQAVPVGKGSYAEFPPPSAGKAAAEMAAREFPLVDRRDRPIPTNKLWTRLLEGKAAGSLWIYPWRVDPRGSGLELHLPRKWNASGNDPVCDAPLRVGGVDFRVGGLQVKEWGDWTLSFRLHQSASRYLDVTVGEGMPIVWVEPHGVEIVIDAGKEAKYDSGQSGSLVISAAGRLYAVFTAPGTKFNESRGKVTMQTPPGKSFAAFAAMQSSGDLASFAQLRYSIPRDSRMDWSYDARRGKVTTTWTVKTEPLLRARRTSSCKAGLPITGGVRRRAQAHRARIPYAAGAVANSLGNRFQWVYDFDGFLPNLPAPQTRGGPTTSIRGEWQLLGLLRR